MKPVHPYGPQNDSGDDSCECTIEPAESRDAGVRSAGAGPVNAAKPGRFGAAAAVEGWTQIADCEARNALQVILSGSEILLEDLFGPLLPDQKMMIDKILASAQRLSIIIATLTKPDDLVGGPLSGTFAAKELFAVNARKY
jgi:hypothetical protein